MRVLDQTREGWTSEERDLDAHVVDIEAVACYALHCLAALVTVLTAPELAGPVALIKRLLWQHDVKGLNTRVNASVANENCNKIQGKQVRGTTNGAQMKV